MIFWLGLEAAGAAAGAAVTPGELPDKVPQVEIFPLDQVRPGMKAVGKTVVAGTEIEEFDVEILGILAGQGTVEKLILVRVSGDAIDRTGGIAAGMSGSPVYIDGKLLGAIGYGFNLTDHRLGMVTPIEFMLDILRLDQADSASETASGVTEWRLLQKAQAAGRQIQRVLFASNQQEAAALQKQVGPDSLIMVPVRTPLLVGGLGPRARQYLADGLASLNLETVAVSGSPTSLEDKPVTLQPGSAFGVQMVRGDVDVTALGTITYRQGNDFVGLGHALMNRGAVNLFVTTAYIYATVDSLSMPFKVGAPLQAVGRLTQDRGAGVAGHLGQRPTTVHLKVKTVDKDLHRTRELEADIVDDPALIVSLMAATALQGLDQGIDRIGPGTSRIVFKIEGKGLPRRVVRDNMFFSPTDISAVSLVELLEMLQLLVENEFQEIGLESVELTAQIEEERRTATIEKASPTVTEVKPGETVDVEVVIRPYRGHRETKILRLPIPESAQAGSVHVTVRGGGLGYPYPEATPFHEQPEKKPEQEETEPALPPSNADNLEKLLDQVLKREKNHELVVEYLPYYDAYAAQPVAGSTGNEAGKSSSPGKKPDSDSNPDNPSQKPDNPSSKSTLSHLPGAKTREENGGSHYMHGDDIAKRRNASGRGGSFFPKNSTPTPVTHDEAPPSETPADWEEEQPEPVKATLPTRFVIEGQTSFELRIMGEESATDEQSGGNGGGKANGGGNGDTGTVTEMSPSDATGTTPEGNPPTENEGGNEQPNATKPDTNYSSSMGRIHSLRVELRKSG